MTINLKHKKNGISTTIECTCGKPFIAYRRTKKYCSDACAKIARTQRATRRYHQKVHGTTQNICNKCKCKVGKGRKLCDDCKASVCIACGAKRSYVRGSSSRNLCGTCYGKYKTYSEIEKLLERFKHYEKMFNSQQVQIEELMTENKALKQQLAAFSTQPILRSHTTNMLNS